ncbi:MAG: Asp-tRNA(Asn)/Glu-tRNA(Gln) amidotransferase subunit GatA [bacterium]|nr:Asp-tRNA(Asn)/Glu-tRNA(Gln) amidotransferase subunit GatA [bacterium]MDE0287158.1 Asp-tRNA(Asn)/Glu-tRNA(Gln) amidotransferase subunit GatA [bacterium]MDE0437501.1 Asp-tRNA(Asn)/Glu-tRNA(Gln) amidotransferase subunit GatA [bacterium]
MGRFSIRGAARALRDGSTTAAQLAEQVLARCSMVEAQVHAYLTLDTDGLRAAAHEADEALAAGEDLGPLHGIPIALKDNMATRGMETTAGSKILSGYHPPYDATAVRRLRDSGALITGKANLDEFAMGSSTENSAYGPTRNPWNTDRVPGGSSGGSAAAVAARMAFGALGSDTGGSIRQPASLCGIVGAKPTYGAVSRYGLIAFASSLDQIGPLTHTVEDAALLLDAVSGHDPLDATSYPGEVPRAGERLGRGLDGVRVGVVSEMGGADAVEPDVEASFAAMVAAMEGAGARIVEVSLPSTMEALSAYYLIAPAECSANLARFDGVRYGLRVNGATTEEMMSRTRAEGFGPEVTRRVLLGTFALSAGYHEAFYGQAQKVRTLVRRDFARAYERCDVLVSPTSPTTAFRLGDRTEDPMSMYVSDVFTIPSNLSGDPAISVPIGLDRRGLPIGFQVMAPALGEAIMFQVAEAVETLAGFDTTVPYDADFGLRGGVR